MPNKKIIIIASVSFIALGIVYLAVKKANNNATENNPKLKADFDALIKKIDDAKK